MNETMLSKTRQAAHAVPAIELRNVHKAYGDVAVIPDASLSIAEGEFVTIIGSSGCGKTTLLKMVNALVEPTSGEIIVHGEQAGGKDPIALRRSIGYVIQGNGLFPHMTVADNVAYVPSLVGKRRSPQTKQAIEKWLRIVGLDESLLHKYPDELSGGQQQRVGIARALAASPDILLMDEPFGSVDEITRVSLQNEIARIHRETGITILFVTHDIREALGLGTRVLVMDRGEIHQYASPGELLERPATPFVERLVASIRAAA